MNLNFNDRVYLITGSTSGIGQGLAKELSEAREYMLKALEVREKDLGERGRVGTTNGFAISYHNLAEISCAMDEIDDGIKFYRKEYELRKQLAEEVGSEENYVNLGTAEVRRYACKRQVD